MGSAVTETKVEDGFVLSRQVNFSGQPLTTWVKRHCNIERQERPKRFCHKHAVGLDDSGKPMCLEHIQREI